MSLLDAAGVVTGDIWCSGAFLFESPLKDLLDSGKYTLEQLLEEDELLQELRGVHPLLIQFFSTEEAVTGLVKYVTRPPPTTSLSPSSLPLSLPPTTTIVSSGATEIETTATNSATTESSDHNGDIPKEQSGQLQELVTTQGSMPDSQVQQKTKDDTVYVRYAYMCCEVICCEIDGVIDAIINGYVPTPNGESSVDTPDSTTIQDIPPQKDDEEPRTLILELLFDMLYDAKPGEIDDYRAGYFDKILSVLFRKRPDALGQFFNQGGKRGSESLMKAMFQHLYAHSIMQIVQRLMLPQQPIPKEKENEGELCLEAMDGMDMDAFGSFRCNWSESEVALHLLLQCLIDTSSYPEIQQDEERQLSMHQNASEVLITIIQNSPLTAPILRTLTTDPVLDKLIQAATQIDEGTSFSPHDSRLTCSMNVLESLILQLGGYGTVATVMDIEADMKAGNAEEGEDEGGQGENAITDSTSTPQRELATSETLLDHLPAMLSSLHSLLTYSGATEWTSPMQFSIKEPQRILGSSRLRIVRLLESLVLLGDPNVDAKLCESKCLECCLDLFWKFQWCSMLHQSVANLLVHVFEGANARAELQAYFLVKCNLLGRLMNSFWDGTSDVQETTTDKQDKQETPAQGEDAAQNVDSTQPGTSEGEGTAEDGPAEQEPLRENGSWENTPPQSFRLGYMGHVIIISQALVHACSSEMGDPSVGGINSDINGEIDEFMAQQQQLQQQQQQQQQQYASSQEGEEVEGGALQQALERGRAVGSVVTDESRSTQLILAQLVESHPLFRLWDEFVQSTLASETAIQSTPLGGFPATPGMDPLHSHRPGLAEEGDFKDDDGAAPPLPPRGLLVGGDVIDMDDNDLDVAASMMAGLSLGGRTHGAGRNDQDLLAGIPRQSGDGPQSGGYMFDDPLGDGRFGRFDGDDDDSSSDEESELSGNTGDSGGVVVDGITNSEEVVPEAPVMDLFAGNFEAFGDTLNTDQAAPQGGDWSDFANFDNAFNVPSIPAEGPEDPFKSGPNRSNIDDIFGEVKHHPELLEEIVDPAEDDAVGKEGSMDDDSSDEEDPVPIQEETAT